MHVSIYQDPDIKGTTYIHCKLSFSEDKTLYDTLMVKHRTDVKTVYRN